MAVTVSFGMVTCVMNLAIDLDGQGFFRAIEIQNKRADGVLTPKPELALQTFSDLDPKQHFGQRHVLSQRFSPPACGLESIHR